MGCGKYPNVVVLQTMSKARAHSPAVRSQGVARPAPCSPSLCNPRPAPLVNGLLQAFGLAGIRCGFAMASPDIIAIMNKMKMPCVETRPTFFLMKHLPFNEHALPFFS